MFNQDTHLTSELKLKRAKVLLNIEELFKYRTELYPCAGKIPFNERKMSTFERQLRHAP